MDNLLILQILKAMVEIALMFFFARGVLVLFFLPARHKLEGNFVYQLFVKGTKPFVTAVRYVTPRFVLDRHLPYAACGLLFACWLGLTIGKLQLCADNLAHQACSGLAEKRAQDGAPGAPGVPGIPGALPPSQPGVPR